MAFVWVGSVAQVPVGSVAEVRVDGNAYALCNYQGQLHVLWGVCPHAHGPLGQGYLQGPFVFCPWHEWAFDCRTGRDDSPRALQLARFAVKVDGDDILLDTEPLA